MRTAVLATILLSFSVFGQIKRLDNTQITRAQIDTTVTRLMTAAEVPGTAISIFHNGKLVFEKAYGFRDTERKLPLTEDSILAAASFSKAAFAYLVMQLVEDQTLDLDKPIQDYLPKPLPEYPEWSDLANDSRYRKITAAMLLSHTAGFPNLRFLMKDHKLNINFEPGDRFAYSGEGITLLQFVVETITQKRLEELMQSRVFQPLRMTRTSMLSQARFEDNYANGYDEYSRSLGHPQRAAAYAAGSMQTTLHDFTMFVQAIIDSRGLHKSTRELMLTPRVRVHSKHEFPTLENLATDANDGIRLSYGLGWGLYWSPYGKVFFKEGHDDGARNYAVVFEKSHDGMVIMTNSSNGEGIFRDLLETLLRDTFTPIEWEGFTPWNQLPRRKPLPVHTEVALDSAKLDRLVGTYAIPNFATEKIVRVGGHLTMQENAETPAELFPESDLRFFSKTSDDVVTFDLDAGGRPIRLVIHTGGQSIPVPRAN
jgi:CubicO group peptidase (beta-lactamase class C family)